jgi:ADP-ribose pyrophosphatase YjhB (NUDIX family)
MRLAANVFDVWVFRRTADGTRYLLLRTSVEKANRYFNGGRFWQIPSGVIAEGETVTQAIDRDLQRYGFAPSAIWAGEHAYIIYNRRFEEMQIIAVYAAEVTEVPVRLDPSEHSEFAWLPAEECVNRVHYRGLKDGLRSVAEYVTEVSAPARELCLFQR